MSTFSIKNAPAEARSWFITIYPASGAPILPPATLPLTAGAQLDVPAGTYPRILVIANTSAPGTAEAYLDAREVKGQALGSSNYTFDWMTGRFS